MSSVPIQRNWKALFFGTFRRQPTSKNYRYKYVAPKIKRQVLNTHTKGLTKTETDPIATRCDRELFTSSVQKIRELILQDIDGPQEACIKVIRTDLVTRAGKKNRLVGVLSWQNIAPIFAHPLNPICSVESNDNDFEFRSTLRLNSEKGAVILPNVHWPNVAYSNSCQGVGVRKERYGELKDTRFLNPSNGKLLPVLEMDGVPEGCDAVGLFPAYFPSHKQYFSGLELCAAVIRQHTCTDRERSNVEAHISSFSKPTHEANVVEQPLAESGFETLKQVIDATTKYQLLWSSGQDKDKTCPGDIIRCSLVSKKVNPSQLMEEYCKHYILFSLISQAQRMYHTIDKTKSYQDKELRYSPMDLFVWQESLEFNQTPLPTSVTEMIQFKEKTDRFLELLSSYYFSIVAEMKSSSRTYFGDTTSIPRAVPVLKVLYAALKECKGIQAFYPNLSLYANKFVPEWPFVRDLKEPSLVGEEASLELGSKVLTMFKEVTEFENTIFYDRFNATQRLEIEPRASLKTWKIVILSKTPLPLEIERALVFNSRVYTQCVSDLEQATLMKHAICKVRKMIDQDTFVFLYQLQRPPEADKDKMVNAIVSKLEGASQVHV